MIRLGIATNAFKGSLTALAAAQAIAQGFEQSRLECHITLMPLADGGDGTLEVMLTQAGSTRRRVGVENALGEPLAADYGVLADGSTAVIEMALASGLALVGERKDALHASTYGTGQLLRHALENGAQRLIVGVGGSATTDGGAGCLQALGVGLLDKEGNPIGRGGAALIELAHVSPSPLLAGIEVLVLCDVDNPPIGERGAAAIFAPQKGATAEQVALLDAHLAHFFGVIAAQTGRDVRHLAGGGAAGALAGGLAALANAKLVPGATTIIQTLNYPLAECDLIITGEGKLDAQTAHGKAPAVIATLAAQHGIPTIALAGAIQPGALDQIQAAFSLVPAPVSLEEALQHAAEWLTNTAYNVGNVLALRL